MVDDISSAKELSLSSLVSSNRSTEFSFSIRFWHTSASDGEIQTKTFVFFFICSVFIPPVGGGEFHQLREGHQLEIVRGVRRGLQQRQQLAVDAVYRARRGQPHLHRDQVFDARLLPLPRHGPLMQRDVFLALLRV